MGGDKSGFDSVWIVPWITRLMLVNLEDSEVKVKCDHHSQQSRSQTSNFNITDFVLYISSFHIAAAVKMSR